MAIRTDFTAGEVLAAADLNDTFGAKLNLAGGKILQIVRATDTTARTTTSTSFVDVTGMSVTITPQKSDSAVLIICSVNTESVFSTLGDRRTLLQITDSSNNAISGFQGSKIGQAQISAAASDAIIATAAVGIAYSTPATTSAVTYKLRFCISAAGTTAQIRNDFSTGQMYAIEVSA